MLEIKNTTKQKFCRRKAQKITTEVLGFYKLPKAEISLVVIGDKKMKTLNYNFHGQNKTTDVLSFPADKKIPSAENNQFFGEIFINIQEAARVHKYQAMFDELEGQSKNANKIENPGKKTQSRWKSKTYIFYFLLIHGLLHLIGYQDKTEKARRAMIALGEKFMKKWYN